MIHTFTFKGISVTVNDQKDSPYIEFDDPSVANIKRRFTLLTPKPDFAAQNIVIEFKDAQMSGETELNARTIQRNGGKAYFDFFFGLVTTLSIGTMIARSSLNNQLENMQFYFGESIKAFDPANDWSPINFPEFSVTSTDETIADANDGTITITTISTGTLEYKVTGEVAGEVQAWGATLSLTGLAPDTYTIEVRNTAENNFEGNPKTVIINAAS